MRFVALFILLIPFCSFSQTSEVTVIVSDFATKTSVPFAKVKLSDKIKGTTNEQGILILKDVPFGEYTMSVIMDDTLITKIKVNTPKLRFPVSLGETLELEEVQVISGAVIGRRTPVPVTRINPKKIQEELGSRDIPMLLNATPGVYATQQGGGDGDARITVRGFDQRNVGVMIDGVPVNDMENGAVYWSNWFGLDASSRCALGVHKRDGGDVAAYRLEYRAFNVLRDEVASRKRNANGAVLNSWEAYHKAVVGRSSDERTTESQLNSELAVIEKTIVLRTILEVHAHRERNLSSAHRHAAVATGLTKRTNVLHIVVDRKRYVLDDGDIGAADGNLFSIEVERVDRHRCVRRGKGCYWGNSLTVSAVKTN
jgi:hypothetical protein